MSNIDSGVSGAQVEHVIDDAFKAASDDDTNGNGNGNPSIHDTMRAADASMPASTSDEPAGYDAKQDEADDAEDAAFGINDTRKKDLMKRVRKYGTAAGQGEESLPKLGIDLVRASVDGVLDLKADKDIIENIFNVFQSRRNAKRMHQLPPNSKSFGVQVSKLSRFYHLGKVTCFDPEEFMDDVVTLYADEAKLNKVKDVYPAYTDAVRMALKKSKDKTILDAAARTPTESEIRAAFRKQDPKSKELADVINAIKTALDHLITGERKDGITTEAPEVIAARDSLAAWVGLYTHECDLNAARAQCAKLGLELAIH